MQICLECGQAFEGNQCLVCVAREADIVETFSLSLWVAGAGIIGTIFALLIYPPLELMSPVIYTILALFLISAAILLALWLCEALTRYAVLARLMILFAAAALVMPAAYYFLNGILDGNSTTGVQGIVLSKYEKSGEGLPYNLECSLSWHGKRIDQSFGVSRETFSAAEPGDSVRVVVHPGAFSTPWSGKGLLTNGEGSIEFERNRQ